MPTQPGQRLESGLRAELEQQFQHDLSRVRVHTDTEAARSARQLQAAAYTVGTDIAFADGRYAPRSGPGRALLAHELTHAIQQYDAAPVSSPTVDGRDSPHEQAAHASSRSAYGASSLQIAPLRLGQQRIQRAPEGDHALKMVPDTAVEGKKFSATGCGNLPGCNLEFNFLQAATGTFEAKESLLASYWRGVRIQLSAGMTPACGECKSLELMQTLRYTKMGANGKAETARPTDDTYARRAGYESSGAAADSLGWAIDAHAGSNQPLFTQSGHGMSGDTTQPAELTDAPGSFPSERDAGKEFNTYLLCVNGAQSIPLGYVEWGYWIDQNQMVRFKPAQPQAFCGASQTLYDAAARWNTFTDLLHLDVDGKATKP